MTATPAERRPPVIFTGPTISPDGVRQSLPHAEVRPPVRRGDLYRERNAGAEAFLIIDGSFSHGFAIAPGEIVDVLRDGARVFGCSSMGAIRAAECWPAGMVGVGVVYRLYKLGILQSDDEVAVTTNPDSDHSALSCALVNIRYALRRAVSTGHISPFDEQVVLRHALGLNFTQRSRQRILAGTSDRLRSAVAKWLDSVDIKLTDARRALRVFAAVAPAGTVDAADRGGRPELRPRTRYTGHDPLVGRPAAELRLELLRWLFGSGRYQRYIWPIAFDELARAGAGDRSPEDLRALLAEAIGRAVQDPERLAEKLLGELNYLDEAGSEIVSWHAVDELSRCPVDHVPPDIERAVREETAVRHGAPNWATLQSHVEDGVLFGAVPYQWIVTACEKLARARTAAADPRLLGPG